MRERTAEISRTFSVYLPISLYQRLQDRAGKGRLNTFIKELLKRELGDSEEQLKQQLIKDYQTQAKSKKLQKELRAMEETQFEDLNNNE